VLSVLSALCGLAGLAAAALSRRRRRRDRLEQLAIQLAGQPSGRYRDGVTTGRSPSGNGIVRTERPSASTD
jgi:transposase InsO family protein